MIRPFHKTDKIAIADYLSKKLNLSMSDANLEAHKILKSKTQGFIKEDINLEGLCWIDKKIINEKPVKRLTFLVNNWRLAEDFIKLLRWNLSGEYIVECPKHDFLNRTLTKNGFRFLRLEDNKNVYNFRFEKRSFTNYKSEDND